LEQIHGKYDVDHETHKLDQETVKS